MSEVLKASYKSKDEIPKGLEGYYKEKAVEDGKIYALQVDGVKTQADLDVVSEALRKEREMHKEAKETLANYEARFSGIPEEFDKNEYHRLMDSASGDKIDEKLREQRERLTKAHEAEIKKRDEKLEATEKRIYELTVEQGMTDALAKANVAEPYLDAAKALLKTKHGVDLSDEGAMIDGQPLAEFIKDWAQSDTGKHYVKAPDNSGGGAGGGKSGNASEVNPWHPDHYNLTEQMKLTKADPEKAERLKKAANGNA